MLENIQVVLLLFERFPVNLISLQALLITDIIIIFSSIICSQLFNKDFDINISRFQILISMTPTFQTIFQKCHSLHLLCYLLYV